MIWTKSDTIYEVIQYNFNPEELTVTPKNVRLPCNEEDLIGIAGLENISKPFKTANISAKVKTREIVSVASSQAKKKVRKSALSNNTKLSQSYSTSPTSKTTENSLEDKAIVKTAIKKRLRDVVKSFKEPPMDIPSSIAAVDSNLANTVQRCLTNDDSSQCRVRKIWVKTIGDLIKAAPPPPHA